jgi:acyl transferase domain-containing protein
MIGSVKTNIGHLEAAAGIASLIKVVLAIQHQEIPPHLHLHQVNAHIDLTHAQITIPTQRTPWRTNSSRFAGVSSFSFSGTNAHLIVESLPDLSNESRRSRSTQILCLSAKTAQGLDSGSVANTF